MSLDTDLKRVLRREAPAPGFAARVLARTDEAQVPRRRFWRATAASFALVAILGGYATHKALEYRRGERARDQVLEAMRIAGEKVRYAREEVRQIGTQN